MPISDDDRKELKTVFGEAFSEALGAERKKWEAERAEVEKTRSGGTSPGNSDKPKKSGSFLMGLLGTPED